MESARLDLIDGGYKPPRMRAVETLLNHRFLDAAPAQANSHDLDWNEHVVCEVGSLLSFLKQRGADSFLAERLVAGVVTFSSRSNDHALIFRKAIGDPASYIEDLAVFCKLAAALKDYVSRGRLAEQANNLRPLAIIQVMLFELLFDYLERPEASTSERAIGHRLFHEAGGISRARAAFAMQQSFRNDFDRQVTGTQEHIYELLQAIRAVTAS